MKIEIIYGKVPSKSNCYKIITLGPKNKRFSSLGKTKALKEYENSFFMQLSGAYRGKDIEGFFELEIDVYYPSMRADLDNCLKGVLDCLQKSKAIRNDNKCVKIVARRFVDKKEPRIEFKLIELDAENT
tara:strand:- start:196 stop:582 length:387 start_codon:yes stop_codon:yes gene_type:complete